MNEAGSGTLSGAGTGAAIGSIVPGIGTAIGAGVGAVVGGIGGLFSGRSKRKQAEQAAINAAKLARIDTEYSPYTAKSGYKVEAQQDTPGGGLSALAGAASGGLQGLNVYRGMKQDEAQAKQLALLQKLAGPQAGMVDLGLGLNPTAALSNKRGATQNPYSMLTPGAV